MSVALQQGAAISHHHGVGMVRLPYIAEALGQRHGRAGAGQRGARSSAAS